MEEEKILTRADGGESLVCLFGFQLEHLKLKNSIF